MFRDVSLIIAMPTAESSHRHSSIAAVHSSIRPSLRPGRPSVRPSIRPSIRPSVRPSIRPSIRPPWPRLCLSLALLSCYRRYASIDCLLSTSYLFVSLGDKRQDAGGEGEEMMGGERNAIDKEILVNKQF